MNLISFEKKTDEGMEIGSTAWLNFIWVDTSTSLGLAIVVRGLFKTIKESFFDFYSATTYKNVQVANKYLFAFRKSRVTGKFHFSNTRVEERIKDETK